MTSDIPSAMLSDRSYYAGHFMDLQLWQPCVLHICQRLGLVCKQVLPSLLGSYPTFILTLASESAYEKVVMKFFGPLYDGHASWQVERLLGHFLAKHPLPIPSPAILFEGRLDADWRFLVFEYIPGVSIGQIRQQLSQQVLKSVAQSMGRFMHTLHLVTTTEMPTLVGDPPVRNWDSFVSFLQRQRADCLSNHQQWHNLPAHLLGQLPDFILRPEQLVDLSSPPHLVHADLTADHLLGRLIPPSAGTNVGAGWDSLAIIDWGDARLGNLLYELVALHVDLFAGDSHLLHTCLQSYGMPEFYRHDFPRKALSMLLLHQFPMPASFYAPHSDVDTLDQLAEKLYA